MVKIKHKPLHTIIIHELHKLSEERLIHSCIIGTPIGSFAMPLVWIDNFLINYGFFPPTEEVITDQLHGIGNWSSLQYCDFKDYQKLIQKDSVSIPVLNVSGNSMWKDVAKFLRGLEKENAQNSTS